YDASQAPLATDAYTVSDPNDPFIQSTLPATGTYYVAVREVRSYIGSPVAFYQLDVHLGPSAQDNTPATATPVTVPRGPTGTACRTGAEGQADLAFSLAQASTLSVDADAQEDLLSLLQGTVGVLLPDGTPLGVDSGTPDPRLSVSLPAGSYVATIGGTSSGL